MRKIGIIGSDNFHASAFSRLCNIPDENGLYLYDDIKITAICTDGDDIEHAKEIAEKFDIGTVFDNPEHMFGKVDAVMIMHRIGGKHIPCALPFIERGYPLWIDKPVASSVEDVELLKDVCEKYNPLIMGGSTLKYNPEVLSVKEKIENGFFGDIRGGSLNFQGNLHSEYDGLYFYGSHLIEEALAIFGYDVKSVFATNVGDDKITVLIKYDDFIIVLNYLDKVNKYFIVVNGSSQSEVTQMDISNIYKCGFDEFVKMLRSGKSLQTVNEMIKPVYIIDSIYKSLQKRSEIILN